MATYEQYQPSYSPSQKFAPSPRFPSPQQQQQYTGPVTLYHPQSTSMSIVPSPHPQGYQQNPEAFEPIYDAPEPRRSSSSGRERRRRRVRRESQSQSEDESVSKSQSHTPKTTGGPLVGAASGALLGAGLGSGKGLRTEGTLGGMVVGTFVGGAVERAYKSQRREKKEKTEEIEHHARSAQDQYNEAYTKVANAAPGYGSSLLPRDTSHGGTVNRNSLAVPA